VIDGGVQPLSGEALSTLLDDVLTRGVPFRFEARGYSMAPFIRDGDVVTVTALAEGRARFGEVVAFVAPGKRLVLHRVTGRRSDRYEIRADNVDPGAAAKTAAVDVVPSSSLLGVVRGVERDRRPVRLGLGPERVVIAGLSRLGLLRPLADVARAARNVARPEAR